MKIGFLYAGQGSQYVGMGKDFYEHDAWCHQLVEELPDQLKNVMFEGPAEALMQTTNNQPAMTTVMMMATHLLKERQITPSYVAGLSLGEYSALACAGVFSPVEAIRLTTFRAQAMAKAAQGIDSSMAAILGLEREKTEAAVSQACDAGFVAICNYNCPGQIVISGEKDAVIKAGALAKKAGARRIVPLKTSGPFHTALLEPAARDLHDYFKQVSFHEMKIPVVFNCSGQELSDHQSVAQMLETQVSHPVYFEDSIRYMIAHGVDTFIEIGPGKVLSGFVRKIDRNVRRFNVEDRETLAKTVSGLEKYE